MNSPDETRVKTGAALALVAGLIAFPTMWGFWIGSILLIVGAITGLTWTPKKG